MTQEMGSIIKIARQNRNLTQDELARRLGITSQAVSKWERNISTPDIGILKELCQTLEISADFLLGIETVKEEDSSRSEENRQIFERLRKCCESLELCFGAELVPLFTDNTFVGIIREMRKKLASKGILVPIIRIRDSSLLEPGRFAILGSEKVLYTELVEKVEAIDTKYVLDRLELTICSSYADILSPDITKMLVDNLRMELPVLIEGVVPERISYHMLTDILRSFMREGNSPRYLKKVIEIAERETRAVPDVTAEEIAAAAAKELGENKSNIKAK